MITAKAASSSASVVVPELEAAAGVVPELEAAAGVVPELERHVPLCDPSFFHVGNFSEQLPHMCG